MGVSLLVQLVGNAFFFAMNLLSLPLVSKGPKTTKETPMRHFRLPLIVTGIVFALVVVAAIGGIMYIDKVGKSDGEKRARGEKLGYGIGTFAGILIAPFWLFAAANLGKERRKALEASKIKVPAKKNKTK